MNLSQQRKGKSNPRFRHGGALNHTRTPEYSVWLAMRTRCLSARCPQYKYYGGRGIKICQRWLGFENFLADMGQRPSPQHSIDRINTNGDYEPDNCRWATAKEQARNTSKNRLITFHGKTLCVREWEEFFGFPRNVIAIRLFNGWSEKDALTTPKGIRRNPRPGAKLSDSDIAVIVSRSKTEPQRQIADDYGIYPSVISRIVAGKAWKHVPR